MKTILLIAFVCLTSCIISEPKKTTSLDKTPAIPKDSSSYNEEAAAKLPQIDVPSYEEREVLYYSWEEFHFEGNESMSIAYIDSSVGPFVNFVEFIVSKDYRVDRSYPVEVYICQSYVSCEYNKRVEISQYNRLYQDLRNPNTSWFISEEYYVDNDAIFVTGEFSTSEYTIVVIKYKRGLRY